MKSIFRSARKPGPSAAGGGGRLKRRAPSSSDESDSNGDESLLPARKQKWRKRSSSVERNSESSSSGGKFAERHADDADVDDAGDCTEIRKACGGRLKKRAAPSSSDSSDDDDPLPPTQKRSSLVQQTSFRRSRRSLGDRKFAALEARRRYVKDRADSTRRQSKLKPAESEAATSRPGASSIELVAGEEHDSAVQWKTLISETPPRPCGSAVEDVARTPLRSSKGVLGWSRELEITGRDGSFVDVSQRRSGCKKCRGTGLARRAARQCETGAWPCCFEKRIEEEEE